MRLAAGDRCDVLAIDGETVVRCRALISVAVITVMHASPAVAQTQEEQALALLRASSAQSAIITFCGKHYAIDGTTALRISQTARDVATKVLGQAQANAAFKDELARRYAEVKEIGEQQWCAEQRAAFADGAPQIFKN
ncbi:hypothetical protein [Methylobacterium sp. J-077]|uniref:hypothetical protein n=1 Tax=Methylobacterium sp. J-077 TaxID=2836656 RepID=UPI001FBB5212|nr:hypothetical protein [Methylobacterium sp. J-077]MCJ2124766.1 hypothetical protein [Methylobacterium sp. J-077]